MKIYVIEGSAGEYSDNRHWLCGAYTDEDRARQVVEEYSGQARVIHQWRDADGDGWARYGYYKTHKLFWPGRVGKTFSQWYHDPVLRNEKAIEVPRPPDYPTHPDPDFQFDNSSVTQYTYEEIDLE